MKRRDVSHFCPELKSTTVIGSLRQQQLLKTMTETHCRRLVMTSVVSRQWTLPPMKGKALQSRQFDRDLVNRQLACPTCDFRYEHGEGPSQKKGIDCSKGRPCNACQQVDDEFPFDAHKT